METTLAMQALAGAGVALVGILVLVAERLLPPPEPGQQPDAVRQALRLTGRVLIVVSLAVLTGPLLPVILGAWLVCVVGVSWRAGWIAIASTLAAAAERGVPFDAALESLAAEERGWVSRRARRLVALLRMGWPLSNALDQVRNPLGRESLAAIHVGEEVGDLATPLRQAYARLAGKGYYWGDLGTRLYYLLYHLVSFVAVASFLQLSIGPAYQKILEDYGTALPPYIEAVIKWDMPSGLLFLVSVALWILGLIVVYACLRYAGWIRWVPPGAGWLVRPFRAADVLEVLALAARRARPFAGPLAILAKDYPGWTFRPRLRRVYHDVQAGADWCQSLRRRGIIGKAEALVLEAAGRAGSLPWALEEMAASLRRRQAYRLRTLAMALFPLGVLAVAVLVGLLVVGFFYPLVLLIESMTTL